MPKKNEMLEIYKRHKAEILQFPRMVDNTTEKL